MSLPASQYSVLDANRIERLDADTFKCYVGNVKIFNFEVCACRIEGRGGSQKAQYSILECYACT